MKNKKVVIVDRSMMTLRPDSQSKQSVNTSKSKKKDKPFIYDLISQIAQKYTSS